MYILSSLSEEKECVNVHSVQECASAYFWGVCGEKGKACFWEECEESTNMSGGKSKKKKTERRHDSAIFLLPLLSSFCYSAE